MLTRNEILLAGFTARYKMVLESSAKQCFIRREDYFLLMLLVGKYEVISSYCENIRYRRTRIVVKRRHDIQNFVNLAREQINKQKEKYVVDNI